MSSNKFEAQLRKYEPSDNITMTVKSHPGWIIITIEDFAEILLSPHEAQKIGESLRQHAINQRSMCDDGS